MGVVESVLLVKAQFGTMNHDFGLLRLKEVMKITSLSKSTIYRRLNEGKFPERMKNLGGNVTAWRVSDIKKYVNGGVA